MRYYIAVGSGYEGPFEAEVVRQKLMDGQLDANTLVCPEGGQSWEALSRFQELAGSHVQQQLDPAPPPPPYRPGSDLKSVSYVIPVLITILCCVIGGVITIVYTAKANTAAVSGNTMEYESAKSNRKGWMIASIAIGAFFTVVYFVIMGLGAMSGTQF